MEWTSSDIAHSHTVCLSIGSKNALKNQLQTLYGFEIQSLQNWTSFPSLAAVRRAVDIFHLWSVISSVGNNAQSSELVPREI